jgi:hypothetical protein
MSNWLISLFFADGVAGWSYTKLVRSNGNPTPYQDMIAAGVAGLVAFVFLFTLLKYIIKI